MNPRDDLEREFTRQRQFLDSFESSSHPAAHLVGQQLDSYLTELSDQLDAIQNREIDFRITGVVSERNSLPAHLLSNLVTRFQGAFTWATWAFRSGPQVEGGVPQGIARASALEVLPLAPGSFRFAFRRVPESVQSRRDAQGQLDTDDDPRDKALDAIVSVLKGAATDHFDEPVEDAVRDMGPTASRSLRFFAKQLSDYGATVDVLVRTEAPTSLTLSSEQARTLSSWLGEVEDLLEDFEVEGVLRVIDTARGRFGLEDAAETLYEGKAAPELLSGAIEGRRYRASVQAVRRVGGHTGGQQERLALLSLTLLEDL